MSINYCFRALGKTTTKTYLCQTAKMGHPSFWTNSKSIYGQQAELQCDVCLIYPKFKFSVLKPLFFVRISGTVLKTGGPVNGIFNCVGWKATGQNGSTSYFL